jgi:hypothetical protein
MWVVFRLHINNNLIGRVKTSLAVKSKLPWKPCNMENPSLRWLGDSFIRTCEGNFYRLLHHYFPKWNQFTSAVLGLNWNVGDEHEPFTFVIKQQGFELCSSWKHNLIWLCPASNLVLQTARTRLQQSQSTYNVSPFTTWLILMSVISNSKVP